MGNKSCLTVALCLFLASFALAGEYANVTYAEGGAFRLVRAGVSKTLDASSPEVFGMEIMIGDIISTGPGTILELSIHPVSASVQIAENTSYSCGSDDERGELSRGELYYGRVRAKVAKLTGTSSFRISSPSLVAGVRGTDFGLDVIAPLSDTPAVNRVFCFEGLVAVSAADRPVLESVTVAAGQMVETLAGGAGSSKEERLVVKPIAEEVKTYWEQKPGVGYVDGSLRGEEPAESVIQWRDEGGYLVLDRPWPRTGTLPSVKRQAAIPAWASATLMTLGSAVCSAVSVHAQDTGPDQWYVEAGYSAGWVMIGSGAALGLVTVLVK